MSSRLIIRKATKADIPEAERIFAEARAFMRRTGNLNQWINGYPEECISSDLERGILYTAQLEGDDRLAAVYAMIYGENDPCYGVIDGAWKNDLPYAVVHRIASSDHVRGKGVSGLIIDRIFTKYGNIRIDTHADNIPMQNFLKKHGFETCGEVFMSDGTPRTAFQKTAGLILASASPRRRELMGRLGRPFVSETSHVEEIVPENVRPEDTAQYLSGIKAEDIFNTHKGEDVTVIGSDTIVILDGKIYGKPHSEEQAFQMLRELSGRIHEVRTGVTVIKGIGGEKIEKRISFTNAARVEFFELTDDEIKAYIETGDPMDKAGAYGVQGQGALFIKRIDGDYYTIMGFPISQIYREMRENDI